MDIARQLHKAIERVDTPEVFGRLQSGYITKQDVEKLNKVIDEAKAAVTALVTIGEALKSTKQQ